MGIKGLTDRNMSFPEIGSIRKGAKKEPTKPGADLQYFRVEFDEREQERAAKFVKVYGDKPAEINIFLPFNEIPNMWDAWYEAYTAGRMVARSDGEKFIYLIDTKTGEAIVQNGEPLTLHRRVVGQYKTQSGKVEDIICKPTGRLKVVVPELQSLAYLTVHTTSIHDIANISAQLEAIFQINGGRLAGIPLVLRRRPKKISMPKPDGSRARMTKWMISIEADPEWVKAKLLQMKTLALPGNGLALLPELAGETQEEERAPIVPPGTMEGQYHEDDDEDEPGNDQVGDDLPPMPEPEPLADPLAWARAIKTPGGKPYGVLSADELTLILEKSKDADHLAAASALIEEMQNAVSR